MRCCRSVYRSFKVNASVLLLICFTTFEPKSPLHGIEVGYDNARELGQEVDNIYSKGIVKMLNSAYIVISNNKKLLGSGSFSKVTLMSK